MEMKTLREPENSRIVSRRSAVVRCGGNDGGASLNNGGTTLGTSHNMFDSLNFQSSPSTSPPSTAPFRALSLKGGYSGCALPLGYSGWGEGRGRAKECVDGELRLRKAKW